MPRVITIRATYPGDPDTIFAEALDLGELRHAMSRIARYDRLPDKVMEEGDRYDVDITLYRLLRTRNHRMHVLGLDRAARVVESRESNPAVARWDHTLTVEPAPGGALWTDRVVLDAGWRTGPTALFCRHVYVQRHRLRGAVSITSRIARGPG